MRAFFGHQVAEIRCELCNVQLPFVINYGCIYVHPCPACTRENRDLVKNLMREIPEIIKKQLEEKEGRADTH